MSGRFWGILGTALVTVALATPAQKLSAPPVAFVIGRDTHFDFGPPFHYYEVISVRPEGTGSRINRIMITPTSDACTQATQLESTTTLVTSSVRDLLADLNPCAVPEKELRKERKRCRRCLVFSGVDVVMQAQCGNQDRQIRIEVLDRDIYDSAAATTPQHTSRTVKLMARLDEALGPGPMEKPAFSTSEGTTRDSRHQIAPSETYELASGKFDALFSSQKISELYRQSQSPPAPPAIRLSKSEPYRPISYKLPEYPPIAMIAHVSGRVRLDASVGTDGHLTNITFLEGSPLFRKSLYEVMASWLYPKDAISASVQISIDFAQDCTSQSQK